MAEHVKVMSIVVSDSSFYTSTGLRISIIETRYHFPFLLFSIFLIFSVGFFFFLHQLVTAPTLGFKTLATDPDVDLGVEGRGGEEKGPDGYFHPWSYNPKIITKAYP